MSEITWRVEIFPRVAGTIPVREFPAAVKCTSEEQLDNADGIVPFSSLESSNRYVRFCRWPREAGISPENRL